MIGDLIVRQTFTKNMASLDAITHSLEAFSNTHGFGGSSRTRLDLVIEELFTNMVKYSRGNGKSVDICIEIISDRLRIDMVECDVDEFNPFLVPTNPDGTPLDPSKSGGRGLFLVKEIADDVSYHYSNRTGTTTVVVKTGDKDV